MIEGLNHLTHPHLQFGQISLNGLPDHIQIDFEVPVGQGISRAVGRLEGEVRMLSRKVREMTLDIACRLSDDLQVTNYRILFLFV